VFHAPGHAQGALVEASPLEQSTQTGYRTFKEVHSLSFVPGLGIHPIEVGEEQGLARITTGQGSVRWRWQAAFALQEPVGNLGQGQPGGFGFPALQQGLPGQGWAMGVRKGVRKRDGGDFQE
jgi:hypothetical protein